MTHEPNYKIMSTLRAYIMTNNSVNYLLKNPPSVSPSITTQLVEWYILTYLQVLNQFSFPHQYTTSTPPLTTHQTLIHFNLTIPPLEIVQMMEACFQSEDDRLCLLPATFFCVAIVDMYELCVAIACSV